MGILQGDNYPPGTLESDIDGFDENEEEREEDDDIDDSELDDFDEQEDENLQIAFDL